MSDNFQAQMQVLEQEDNTNEPSVEDIAHDISTIVTTLDRSERTTRDRMLRLWKYLELLWSGAGNYYWDHMSGQWRAITQEDITLLASDADVDPTLINKVINLIRPYGESLVGVLTTGLPRVKYFPKSADNDLDIQASRSYSDVEQKIVDDNMMPIKMMEILVKLWNGGFAAAYNYTHTDKKYGVTEEDVFVEKDFSQESLICSNCGNETLGEEVPKVTEATDEEAENVPISLDEQLEDQELEVSTQSPEMGMPIEPEMPEMKMVFCSVCQVDTPHLTSEVEGRQPFKDGTVELPKSRQIINIFGPMNVKIPSMATRKEHIFWLILEEELDVAQAKHLYPDHKDKIEATTGSDIDIDRMARASYEVSDDTLRECSTIRKVWLTPAAFEKLTDQNKVANLKQKYPNGIKAIFSADKFLEAEEEDLHEQWTISINPLYTRVMADPLGKALIGLHETANDLFQLEVDTVRYSIPQTFVDPKFLDLKAYQQQRAIPGGITALKTISAGAKASDGFFETKTATIPKEVENLDLKVEKLLQFISGVLPSVFGGPATGSKTLGEYQESKNQALQRLSIIWKIVVVMYAELMAKATKQYVKNLREDEFFVKEQGAGSYINVWLRRETFKGEIGEVRPEISEQFPMTWGQKSARIMELLTMNNQMITAWLLHPENIEIIYQTFGITDMYIPGEDQRNKQLYEISEMMIAQPIPMGVDPLTGQEAFQPPQPSQIEMIDDDTIHMEVIKAFLNSTIGIDLKMTNPIAYQTIMMHYQMHMQNYQMMMAAQAEQQAINEAQASDTEQVQ
jgi:hypothetical protein